jgi:hypothetical protein
MVNRRQLYRYKGNCCAHCRRSVEEVLKRYRTIERFFEFNHVNPSDKHPDYDNLIRRVISTEQLDEVDKCVLLCGECHSVVHAQHITAKFSLAVRVGKRQVEQTFSGQMIIDFRDRKGTFLTADRPLIIPYKVYLGGRHERVLFGRDLEQGDLLNQFLAQLDKIKSLTIRSCQGELLLRATHVRERYFNMAHSIKFPLISAELGQAEGQSPDLWVRNGEVLMRDGGVFHNGTISYEMMTREQATK